MAGKPLRLWTFALADDAGDIVVPDSEGRLESPQRPFVNRSLPGEALSLLIWEGLSQCCPKCLSGGHAAATSGAALPVKCTVIGLRLPSLLHRRRRGTRMPLRRWSRLTNRTSSRIPTPVRTSSQRNGLRTSNEGLQRFGKETRSSTFSGP